MKDKTPQVDVPASARAGDIILIKTKAWHPMETGWRKDTFGNTVPKNRIEHFVCTFNGTEVFSADFHSGVSANPYLAFHAKVTGSGRFLFEWHAGDGTILTASAPITTAAV